MTTVEGGCHCGNIRYRFESDKPSDRLPVIACNCEFCSRHGALYSFDSKGQLSVAVKDGNQAHGYRFGSKLADFVVCDRCGIMPVVAVRIDGLLYGIVNINTADDPGLFEATPVHVLHDQDPSEVRLDRWAKAWIGDVTVKGLEVTE